MKFKGIEEAKDDWKELEGSSVFLNPFTTYGYAHACVEYHAHVKTGKAAILEKDNKPIALLPVFHPKNKGDYAGLLIREGYEKDHDVVEFVNEVCKLEKLYPYPISDGITDQWFKDNFKCVEHKKAAYRADISQGYDAHFNSLDKSLRYDLRRLVRKLERETGKVEFDFRIGDRDLETEMDKFLNLNSIKWGPRFRNMKKFMMSHASLLKNNLWLSFMKVNGINLYGCFVYVFRDTAYYYLGGFNLEFKKFMPGFIILDAIIHECCNEGVKIFDFLKGESPYKQRLGGIRFPRYRITEVK